MIIKVLYWQFFSLFAVTEVDFCSKFTFFNSGHPIRFKFISFYKLDMKRQMFQIDSLSLWVLELLAGQELNKQ